MNNINNGLTEPLSDSMCYLDLTVSEDDFISLMNSEIIEVSEEEFILLMNNEVIEVSEDDFILLMNSEVLEVSEDDFILLMNSEVIENMTKDWLYDSKSSNYERVLKKVSSSAPHDSKFNIPEDQVLDYFHQYLIDELIEKDRLKSHLENNRKINVNAIYVWFKQYCVREKYVEGQDAVQRTRGAKTQSEVLKIKAFENKETEKLYTHSHNIKNLESTGFQVAQVINKTDSETGNIIGEPDYYVEDNTDDLEQRSMNDHVKYLIKNKFGEKNVNKYYSLYIEMLYDEFANNKKKWCEARRVTKRILNYQIDQIQDLIRSNASDFGF